jgi:hypothetical protein
MTALSIAAIVILAVIVIAGIWLAWLIYQAHNGK